MLWRSSLPQQFSAVDHLSGQVVMHPDASWPPGSRNYGPSRGRQTGAFLQLFEENICPYPLFSIHALKRLSSLSTGADLLRRKLFNPSVPTAVKSSHGEAIAILSGPLIPQAPPAPSINNRLSSGRHAIGMTTPFRQRSLPLQLQETDSHADLSATRKPVLLQR